LKSAKRLNLIEKLNFKKGNTLKFHLNTNKYSSAIDKKTEDEEEDYFDKMLKNV
jgi:hypothetical protein